MTFLDTSYAGRSFLDGLGNLGFTAEESAEQAKLLADAQDEEMRTGVRAPPMVVKPTDSPEMAAWKRSYNESEARAAKEGVSTTTVSPTSVTTRTESTTSASSGVPTAGDLTREQLSKLAAIVGNQQAFATTFNDFRQRETDKLLATGRVTVPAADVRRVQRKPLLTTKTVVIGAAAVVALVLLMRR
jgi:hypothetical protein